MMKQEVKGAIVIANQAQTLMCVRFCDVISGNQCEDLQVKSVTHQLLWRKR
jgi:hypothetical protein